jgi:hypothetical protein
MEGKHDKVDGLKKDQMGEAYSARKGDQKSAQNVGYKA